MKRTHITKAALLALVLAGAAGVRGWAQSADALIDKLVDKGILSVKEANDLRDETEKNFSQAYAVKSGMPDWVTSFKLTGDVRLRYENFSSPDGKVLGNVPGVGITTNDFASRDRFRMRLRFGATVTMLDNLEAGLRLTSSEQNGSFGGDPISGNSTFKDNASKKYIFIDQAYAKWNALNGPDLSGNITIGKMENPFVFSDMVFDPDYTPEGLAIQSAYRFDDRHTAKLNLGAFVLDELDLSAHDPALFGAQARWDATWSKKVSSSMGIAGLIIGNSRMLNNGSVPNVNVGNTRANYGFGNTATNLAPAYYFNPIVGDASATYTLDSFPLYRGTFPVKLGGEYMINPAAPDFADNHAWNVGVTFGKAGKRGTWEFAYAYKWLGANSWYEELVDSDFGALYFRGPEYFSASSGTLSGGAYSGYGAGTNVKGHIVRLAYSPADALTLSVKWFLSELINPFPSTSVSDMRRLQVDATLKF